LLSKEKKEKRVELQNSTDQKAKTYKGKRKTESIISLTIIMAKKGKKVGPQEEAAAIREAILQSAFVSR